MMWRTVLAVFLGYLAGRATYDLLKCLLVGRSGPEHSDPDS